MASSVNCIFIFTVFVISVENANTAFVKVQCNAENVGQHGHQSRLECVIQTTEEAADAEIRMVIWTKVGVDSHLLDFNEDGLQAQRGYGFAEPSWNEKNMNVSLLISNTVVAHEGDYKCMVITDSGDDSSVTSLKVKAKYRTPTVHSIPEKINPNADSTLICTSDGGYPKGELRWFDEHNKEWTKSSEMEVTRMDSGLFQLTSKLTLLSGSTFSKYSCVVFNASGGKEDATTFEISPTPEGHEDGKSTVQASKIAAPLVVIGSLIVGLLLALLIYRRRSQQARRPSAAALMSDHHEVSSCEADVEKGDHEEVDKYYQDSAH